MKIAFCASEVVPFSKTGGLADVCGSLPLALEKLGQEVVVVIPLYKAAREQKAAVLKRFKDDIWTAVIGRNTRVYFVENDAYFHRDGIYGDKAGDYPDNLERFAFFNKRCLRLFRETGFRPDILHCHDWQTSLLPAYLKAMPAGDDFFRDTRTLLTIHNIGYQGIFPKAEYPLTGLDAKYFNPGQLEYYDKINLLKGGIVFSDAINTVSRTYAREIQTKEFGFGLEGVLKERGADVFGIINGVDYDIWDPETDAHLAKRFSAEKFKDKAKNKADLQNACSLPVKDLPVIGIVSRLAQQKGFDIICQSVDEICRLGVQLVILGSGDRKYHHLLAEVARKHPESVSLNSGFNDELAHKIYGGADAFLMPSSYEPCGLGQLIAFRYGTVPIVFKTGGLVDTVSAKTGFMFDHYSGPELVKTVARAVARYTGHRAEWNEMAVHGMKLNFSWDESAVQYVCLYEKIRS